MLRDLLPQPGLIAFLADARNEAGQAEMREVEAAAQALGQPILVLRGRSDDEVEKAFATMAERQARGLVYGAGTYFQVIADKLVALAARFEQVINLKTAEALGLTVPQSLLVRADEVIE